MRLHRFTLRPDTTCFCPRFRKFRRFPAILAATLSCLGGTLPALASSIVRTEPERPPAREAACVLVIQRSLEGAWPDWTILSALLQSSEVADAPARDILGLAPETRARKVSFEIKPQDRPGTLTLSLRIRLDVPEEEPPDLARPYLAVVVDRFRDALYHMKELRTARLETEIRTLAEQMGGTERDLAKVRAALQALDEKTGMLFPTAMQLRAEQNQIQNQISNIMLYLDGCRRQPDPAGSPVEEGLRRQAAEAWGRVVSLLEERLQDLRRLAGEGKADPLEVAEFEARLAEARANAVPLAQPLAYGRRIVGLQRDPGETERAAAEREKELERLLERLRQVEKLDVRRMASEMEDLEKEERGLLERRDAVAAQIGKLKQELTDLAKISVEVIGK